MRTMQRNGLTLVELLVVVSIIGLLGGIVGLIAPRFAERSRVASGSSQLRGWLLIAKQRAMRDKAPRGVRIITAVPSEDYLRLGQPCPSNLKPTQILYRKFAYVEQPEDITGMAAEIAPATADAQLQQLRKQFQLEISNQLLGMSGNLTYSQQQRDKFSAYRLLLNPADPKNDPTANPVPAGYTPKWPYLLWLKDRDLSAGSTIIDNDIVEFGGARYAVIGRPFRVSNQPGSVLVLHRPRDESRSTLSLVISNPSLPSYRITRAPRPIAGEPELSLPKNVAIDILSTNMRNPPDSSLPISVHTRSLPAPDVQTPGSDLAYDIMFGPSGEVVSGNLATVGRIAFWLRDTSLFDPGAGKLPDGENRLLVVHCRTGQVTSHPVNDSVDGNNVLTDPYRFIRDGKSSAMEE